MKQASREVRIASVTSFVDLKSSLSSPEMMRTAQHASTLFLRAHLNGETPSLEKRKARDATVAHGAAAEIFIK